MKTAVTRLSFVLLSLSISSFCSAKGETEAPSVAPNSTAQPVVTTNVPASTAPAPKLPYGAEEVLTLSRSHVSDDVILTYIQNTGTVYNLSPQDIVYLRNQGVSDRVLNTMVDQRRKIVETSPQAAVASSAPATVPNSPTVPEAPVQVAPEPIQSTPQVAAPGPSTVYVMPPPAPVYPSYYYYPAYGYYAPRYYYPGYYGPTVSFGFGFSSGSGHGHWHGYGGHHH